LLGVVSTAAMAGLLVRSPETMSRNKRCLYTINTAARRRLRSCNAAAVCSSSVSLDVTLDSVPKVGGGTVSVDPLDWQCHGAHLLLTITRQGAVSFHFSACQKEIWPVLAGLCLLATSYRASLTYGQARPLHPKENRAETRENCTVSPQILLDETIRWQYYVLHILAGGGDRSFFSKFARVYLTLSAM
jgi:hypothetical protein